VGTIKILKTNRISDGIVRLYVPLINSERTSL
jgi:hypothetical protein